MRILILGATGMLGHKLVEVLAGTAGLEVHATVRQPPAGEGGAARLHALEIGRDSAGLRAVLETVRPDVVVNAIGAIKQRDLYSAVDETFYLNATLPHLIPLLSPTPVRVIHFSTDCVFVGDRGGYRESDAPDAQDLYGRSKACGELLYGPHLTIRTSIIGFEKRGQLGLLSWLLQQPGGKRVRGYRRAIFSGLPTVTLARTVRQLLLSDVTVTGLWHVAAEPIAKYDLLVRVSRELGLDLELVPDDDFVLDRSLDDSRFRKATGTARPGWDELVQELVEDFRSGGYAGHHPRNVLS